MRAVALEELRPALQGVIPAWLATCSHDGVPNVTLLSIIHYVDSERVALTRQFFNKTTANLDANPYAQALVVDPQTGDQYLLDLRYLHTETEGSTFDAVAANLDAVASQTGMVGVFRLRGVDIHRVLESRALGEPSAGRPTRDDARTLASLDELVRRLSGCADYADTTRAALEALDDLFGFRHAILLAADERGDRLFAVASNGYPSASAGAEVPLGTGVIGIAAERRRIVCVPSLTRSRAMRAGVAVSVEVSGGELSATEIPLPGLAEVESVAAVPLVAHGELHGVLYLESGQLGTFGPAAERLLRILGGHLAVSLALSQADRDEVEAVPVGAPAAEPHGEAIAVVYYQADDSVFVDDEYLIKGVPGRILRRLLRVNLDEGRTAFTNRELRLDETLQLPIGNDNLEARLLVLRQRLAGAGCGIALERVGRGRLELRLERPFSLTEVPSKNLLGKPY